MNDRWITAFGLGALALAGIVLVAVVSSGDDDDDDDGDLPVADAPDTVEEVFDR
jgi:hypothetical protein